MKEGLEKLDMQTLEQIELSPELAIIVEKFKESKTFTPKEINHRCFVYALDLYDMCKNNNISTDCYEYHFTTKSGKPDFEHLVNITGDIGIDWTARQMPGCKDAPIPLIYKLNPSDPYHSRFENVDSDKWFRENASPELLKRREGLKPTIHFP